METIVGFVAGYLVGTREGREGLDRLRSSWNSIRTSPEVRKLATEAVSMAEMAFQRTPAATSAAAVARARSPTCSSAGRRGSRGSRAA